MRIALIGYGKMGKAIERIAVEKGHEISLKIDLNNEADLIPENLSNTEVAIEFTGPTSAAANLMKCANAGVSVVCGSTGWMENYSSVKIAFENKKLGFIYASNFSIGVNIFFELNNKLAQLMKGQPEYKAEMKEIHHTQKKDAPSGTAITLAEGIISEIPSLKKWVNHKTANPSELPVVSERIDPAPGTHIVKFQSAVDDIEIVHTAHSREGFAIGAVLAAEFLKGKQGIFTMKEVLGL